MQAVPQKKEKAQVDFSDVTIIGGIIATAVGIGMISIPVAIIFIGVTMMYIGLLFGRT